MNHGLNQSLDALFIDLDRTILIYDDLDMENNIVLRWLSYLGYQNPEKLFYSEDWNKLEERYKMLDTNEIDYKLNLRPKFQKVELDYKQELFRAGKVTMAAGAACLLKNINIPTALISNSAYPLVDFMVQEFGINGVFDFVYRRPYNFEDIRKPDCRVGFKAMHTMGLLPTSNIVMVGDSMIDMKFARNCGFKAFNIASQQEDYDHFFLNFQALHQYFKKVYKVLQFNY